MKTLILNLNRQALASTASPITDQAAFRIKIGIQKSKFKILPICQASDMVCRAIHSEDMNRPVSNQTKNQKPKSKIV